MQKKKQLVKWLIKIPIEIISKDEKIVKYLQIDEESSLKDKLRLILDTLSNEYFNGLDMEVEVKEKDNLVKINLIEPDKKSRVSWKDDYLNEQNIIYTINNIIKNVIQEEDNSIWIEEVEIYYNGKLIELR